jgi:hypothetical protein
MRTFSSRTAVGPDKIQAFDRAQNFSGGRRELAQSDMGIAWVACKKPLCGRAKSTRNRAFADDPMRVIFL